MRLIDRDVTSMRVRLRWARSIDRLLGEIGRRPPLVNAARPLYPAPVAAACAPALSEIRSVLLDPSVPVTPQAMDRLRAFLTDGAESPLYRPDVLHARRASRELTAAFVFPAVMQSRRPAPADRRTRAARPDTGTAA